MTSIEAIAAARAAAQALESAEIRAKTAAAELAGATAAQAAAVVRAEALAARLRALGIDPDD